MERVADAVRDDNDSLCVVEVDEEEKQDIEIDDDVSCSSDEGHTDDDSMSNSFDKLTNKVISTWCKCRSKLIHDYAQASWKLSPNPIIIADAKDHAILEETDAVESLLLKLVLSPTLVGEERKIEKGSLIQDFWDAKKLFYSRYVEHNEGYV